MQNIFVMRDPLAPLDPCAWVAQPASGSIYSNDQNIQWKLIADPASNTNWDPGTNPPIVFGDDWDGTIPQSVDNPSGPPLYQATGSGQTPIAPNPQPIANAIRPATRRIFTLAGAGRELRNNPPARSPRTIVASVGMKLSVE